VPASEITDEAPFSLKILVQLLQASEYLST